MKYILYIGLVFIACVAQVTLNDVISIKTIVPDFPVIMLCFIGLHEGRRAGALYGFLTGMVVNSLSGGILGAGPLIYTVIGFFAGSVLGGRSFHHIYELLLACALVFVSFYLFTHIVLYLKQEAFFVNLWRRVLPAFLYTFVMFFFLLLCSPPSFWRGRQTASMGIFGNEM